jgi:hypothetical protein
MEMSRWKAVDIKGARPQLVKQKISAFEGHERTAEKWYTKYLNNTGHHRLTSMSRARSSGRPFLVKEISLSSLPCQKGRTDAQQY